MDRPTCTHEHESTRARPREHDHEHESMSTRCTRARARGGQAICASRQQNSERHAQPVRFFLNPVRGFASAWMALRARNASPWLLANFRDFDPPEHVPRTSARARTCAVVFGRAPCSPRSREHEKDPGRKRKKCPCAKKNTHLYEVHSNIWCKPKLM